MVLEFPILAEYAFLDLDGQTVFATHGHKFNPLNPPMLKKGDILLYVTFPYFDNSSRIGVIYLADTLSASIKSAYLDSTFYIPPLLSSSM